MKHKFVDIRSSIGYVVCPTTQCMSIQYPTGFNLVPIEKIYYVSIGNIGCRSDVDLKSIGCQ